MLPMLVPSAIALFVMSFISGWNNYEATLLYMKAYKAPAAVIDGEKAKLAKYLEVRESLKVALAKLG